MPHVVTKLSLAGSAGDLKAITEFLAGEGINIIAIGGGEGVFDPEVGVLAMVLEPDDDTAGLKTALENLSLDPNADPPRTPANVEMLDNVHILLRDAPGALAAAAGALAGINIRSVISMGNSLGTTHVSLGFDPNDTANAITALQGVDDLIIVPTEEGHAQ
jgi:hypothetical protein